MRKIHLYIPLILSLMALSLSAMPRLTVVAIVDGMTTEDLNALRPYWMQGGIRTLSEEAFQTTVQYPHLVYGGNETTATLVTGATPDRHGYTMDSYYLRRDRKKHAMLEDADVRGIGTTLQLSPKALLSQTMTDRLRVRYPAAKIYAIGIHPETTVLLAGHAANACCWIDSESQEWVATAAYSEGLPVVGIEAQAAGLPCLFSDSITREVDICNTSFLSIYDIEKWIDEIYKLKDFKRQDCHNIVADHGYDMKVCADKLVDFYLSIIRGAQ